MYMQSIEIDRNYLKFLKIALFKLPETAHDILRIFNGRAAIENDVDRRRFNMARGS